MADTLSSTDLTPQEERERERALAQVDAFDRVNSARAVVTREDIEDIKSLEDLEQFLADNGALPEDIEDYSDGFALLTDKNKLVDVDMIVLDFQVKESTYPARKKDGTPDKETTRYYAVMSVITPANERLVVVDGGTGIPAQLLKLAEKRHKRGIAAKTPFRVTGGLRASTYVTEIDDQPTSATTFYLAVGPRG